MPIKPPDKGLLHTFTDGQWVGSIAIKYGFADWETDVWKHAENTNLRKRRPDPHVVAPGDDLFIPAWEEKEESCATEQKHTFQLKTPTEAFRLRVLDVDGEPVKDAEYTLEIESSGGGVVYKQQNKKTDGEGQLEEVIPSSAKSGKLRVPSARINMDLPLGQLYPADAEEEKISVRGVQQRLAAINMYHGEITGELDHHTKEAIALFQGFCKANKGVKPEIIDAGEANGKLTKQTKDALIKYYGC